MIEDLIQYLPQPVTWTFRRIVSGLTTPLQSQARIYWFYLLVSAVLATGVYIQTRRHKSSFSVKGWLHYLFPRRIFLHTSAIVDYKIYLVLAVFRPLVRATSMIVGPTLVAAAISKILSDHFTSPAFDFGSAHIVVCTALLFLAADFGNFFNHWLFHRLRALWMIHRLHHTALVLTPITGYRGHPVYHLIKAFIHGPIAGTIQGVIIFLLNGDINTVTILGLNAVVFLSHIIGSNLHHSHVWLSFGPVLNRIFISPATHQIHHSSAPEHRMCNFGVVMSIWDWMWGTLVLPDEKIRKNLVLGIGEETPQLHPTLTAAMVEPLQACWSYLTDPRNTAKAKED